MSPDGQTRGRKVSAAATWGGNPSNNLYTVILALAFSIVLAAAAFVAYMCYFQYETIFKIP